MPIFHKPIMVGLTCSVGGQVDGIVATSIIIHGIRTIAIIHYMGLLLKRVV